MTEPPDDEDSIAWRHEHWLWPVETVRAIIADTTHAATFFYGGLRNFRKFLDLIDKIFVPDMVVETLTSD